MSNGQENKSIIAPDVEITGTIKSNSGIRIEGKLEGEMICAADITVGKSATIKGNLSATSVTIEGTIHGNITVKDKIEMKSTAKVHGDIVAKRLSVEDGVTFIGRSEVNPAAGSGGGGGAATTPAPVPAPEGKADAQGGIFGRR